MSIRILGGKFKGRSLEVPSEGTRPTSVILRRRLFDTLLSLKGYHFVDLCAGSGGVGLEAVSRGASQVTFIDKGKRQISQLKKNIDKIIESNENINIFQCSATSWLKRNSSSLDSKSILFFDPPYEDEKLYFSFFEIVDVIDKEVLFLVEASNKTSFYKKIVSHLNKFEPRIIRQGDKEVFWF